MLRQPLWVTVAILLAFAGALLFLTVRQGFVKEIPIKIQQPQEFGV